MKYRGFYIFRCKDTAIKRENKDGEDVTASGYRCLVCADKDGEQLIDSFTAAEGFEIPDLSAENADMFAHEMVDIEYKEYSRIRDKYA